MPLPISSRVYLLSVLMDVLGTLCSRITYRTCSHSTIVFSRRDRLWPISFGVNDTKKAKRLIAERQNLCQPCAVPYGNSIIVLSESCAAAAFW